MNLSAPFVRRPVGTVLLTVWIALAGIAAFFQLPVASLPQVDFPVISVSASLPGASPETMATSVAQPLERRLGTIAGVNEMTSRSGTGSARISLQFDLNRNIDAAAREVQAAINAARADLPATLRSNPTYRKRNSAASPVIILALTSKTRTPGEIYDAVSNVVSQRLSQVDGVGEVEIGGGSLPAVRVELLPFALHRYGISTEDVRAAIQASNANRPKGAIEGDGRRLHGLLPLRLLGARLGVRRGVAGGERLCDRLVHRAAVVDAEARQCLEERRLRGRERDAVLWPARPGEGRLDGRDRTTGSRAPAPRGREARDDLAMERAPDRRAPSAGEVVRLMAGSAARVLVLLFRGPLFTIASSDGGGGSSGGTATECGASSREAGGGGNTPPLRGFCELCSDMPSDKFPGAAMKVKASPPSGARSPAVPPHLPRAPARQTRRSAEIAACGAEVDSR